MSELPRAAGAAAHGEGYGWHDLAGDASGGAIAALVALPYGLALARLMGLPPELGLFTSILTAPVTSLLGRNPVLDRRDGQRDRAVHRGGRAVPRASAARPRSAWRRRSS